MWHSLDQNILVCKNTHAFIWQIFIQESTLLPFAQFSCHFSMHTVLASGDPVSFISCPHFQSTPFKSFWEGKRRQEHYQAARWWSSLGELSVLFHWVHDWCGFHVREASSHRLHGRINWWVIKFHCCEWRNNFEFFGFIIIQTFSYQDFFSGIISINKSRCLSSSQGDMLLTKAIMGTELCCCLIYCAVVFLCMPGF